MASIVRSDSLSWDTYTNLGNYFQDLCLSNPSYNIVLRTGIGVCAKTVGRVHDIFIHVVLGSIKLTASVTLAIYSIPAAAFDCIPSHHKIAKQASRHFGLAAFYAADIPLSLTNIINKYPERFVNGIQKRLMIENICEETAVEFDEEYQPGRQRCINTNSQKIQKLKEQNKQLEKALSQKNKDYEVLAKAYNLQEELIQVYKQIEKEESQETL